MSLGSKNDVMSSSSMMTGSLYLFSISVHIVSFIMANAVSHVSSTVNVFFRFFKTESTADAVIGFSPAKASLRYDNGFKISETVSKIDSSLSYIILCQFILSYARTTLKACCCE